jgi:glycine/D-amino acid oxidase-like deaminating enzyme
MPPHDPFTLELVLATGLRISGDLGGEDIIRHQVGMEGQIHWREEPPDDHDRAMEILVTAMDYHLQREGEFAMTDRDGRYWIVRTSQIVAVSITDPRGPARPVGFTLRE